MQWHRDNRDDNGQTFDSYYPPVAAPSPPTTTPVTPHSTQIILMQHGCSTFNATEMFQGSSDEAVLTEIGRQASRQTGAWLRGVQIDAIYASPLKRVQQTVKELLVAMEIDLHHLPIHLHWHLREIDLPAWEGLSFEQVRHQFAADYQVWQQRPHQFQMSAERVTHSTYPAKSTIPSISTSTTCTATQLPPFFPVLELYDRVQRFWQDILPRHQGQRLLVVSHSDTNHALINLALGLSPQQHHKLQQSSSGISILNFANSGLSTGQIQTLNTTCHLGEGLPQLKQGKRGLRLLLLPVPLTSIQQSQIRELLQEVKIDFSLSAEEVSQETMAAILANHPQTVHLQVAREDVAQVWQKSIMQRKTDAEHLITGLMVAPIPIVQDLLQQAIGVEQPLIKHLALQAGHLSVIHYPNSSYSPVLQTVNLGFDHKTLT